MSAGVCRQYLVGPAPAQEATTCFIRPNLFMLDVEGFYGNQPANSGTQALTACDILRIDRPGWRQLS